MSTDKSTIGEFWRMSRVIGETGLSRATIYSKVADGSFPSPIKLSERASAFISDEVNLWKQERIAASRGDNDSAVVQEGI